MRHELRRVLTKRDENVFQQNEMRTCFNKNLHIFLAFLQQLTVQFKRALIMLQMPLSVFLNYYAELRPNFKLITAENCDLIQTGMWLNVRSAIAIAIGDRGKIVRKQKC
jgi:hypothetical protein